MPPLRQKHRSRDEQFEKLMSEKHVRETVLKIHNTKDAIDKNRLIDALLFYAFSRGWQR